MNFVQFIYFIVAILVALTTHEAAHAWAAHKLGDPTAKRMGRLSLNPLRHLDFWGSMLFLFIGIGWGKPVPIDDRNFQHQQRDNALVALAGPMTNLLTAIIIAVPIKYLPITGVISGEIYAFNRILFELSLILFALNLLPIPPLDGSKIFGAIIPAKYYNRYRNFMEANLVYIIIFFLLDINLIPRILGFSIISTIIGFITTGLKTIIFLGT